MLVHSIYHAAEEKKKKETGKTMIRQAFTLRRNFWLRRQLTPFADVTAWVGPLDYGC